MLFRFGSQMLYWVPVPFGRGIGCYVVVGESVVRLFFASHRQHLLASIRQKRRPCCLLLLLLLHIMRISKTVKVVKLLLPNIPAG